MVYIHQIMQDVSRMVVEQGEQINHIEIDIKSTHSNVKDAEKELITVSFY